MLLKRLPVRGNFVFMRLHRRALLVSGFLLAFFAILIPLRGLNYGIDFEGGVVVEVKIAADADLASARAVLGRLDLGDFAVQEIGDGILGGSGDVFLIRTEIPAATTSEESESAVQMATSLIITALRAEFGELDIRRSEAVGPKVSAELLRDGMTALVVALLLMLMYIWFRFEWQFSLGAILALSHDVFLTIGMFSLTRLEFNLTTIAALLTIIGYSMNDTVVVYDRVREELRRYKKIPLDKVIDMALNGTLSRTILTSGTTLLALLSIFIFGGEVLRGFSFAMIWGVVIGTYSSIFIASAMLLYTGLQKGRETSTSEDSQQ